MRKMLLVLSTAGALALGWTGTASATPPTNCTEARVLGLHDIPRGDPNYAPHLDGDGDGIACESGRPVGTHDGERVGVSPTPTLVPAQLAATGSGFPTAPAVALGTTLVLVGAGAQVLTRRRTGRHTT